MSAGCRHFEGALDMLLPSHIVEIDLVTGMRGKYCMQVDARRREWLVAVEEEKRFTQSGYAKDLDARDHRGLGRIFGRHDQPLESFFSGHHRQRQSAMHCFDAAIEGQFTQ